MLPATARERSRCNGFKAVALLSSRPHVSSSPNALRDRVRAIIILLSVVMRSRGPSRTLSVLHRDKSEK